MTTVATVSVLVLGLFGAIMMVSGSVPPRFCFASPAEVDFMGGLGASVGHP